MKAEEIAFEVDGLKFEESAYTTKTRRWSARTLAEAAKDCPVFDLPLIAIDLSVNPWVCDCVLEHAQHMKRVIDSDLKYPVIMDDYGYICDGWHRAVKAMLLGRKTIKAKRLTAMPEPDKIFDE